MCWRSLPRTKASLIKRSLDVQDQPFSVVWSNAGMGVTQKRPDVAFMLRKGEVQRLVALRPASAAPRKQ